MGPGQDEASASAPDFGLPVSCIPDPVWVWAEASEEALAGGWALAAAVGFGVISSAASVGILILRWLPLRIPMEQCPIPRIHRVTAGFIARLIRAAGLFRRKNSRTEIFRSRDKRR